MAEFLWIFWSFSLLGWGLERLFAAVTRSPQRRRRCLLLLPLCPVYGLGMAAVLALLGVYAVVMLPFWVWCIGDTYQLWTLYSQGGSYSYSSSLHFFPLWDRVVTALAWWAMGHPWVFALPGAALCILGFPRQRTEQPEPQTENVDSPE